MISLLPSINAALNALDCSLAFTVMLIEASSRAWSTGRIVAPVYPKTCVTPRSCRLLTRICAPVISVPIAYLIFACANALERRCDRFLLHSPFRIKPGVRRDVVPNPFLSVIIPYGYNRTKGNPAS